MTTLSLPTLATIDDDNLQSEIQALWDNKTKPQGSLGRLESLAMRIGLIQGSTTPSVDRAHIRVFAADHGLAQHGTSAFPTAVTAQMVLNFLNGGAAINVLARQHEIELKVVDAGVAADFADFGITDNPQLISQYKVRLGSRDALNEPAMTQEECVQAINAGMEIAKQLDAEVFIAGEMGIGNTSAASLLLSRLEDIPIAQCIGRGTGLDDAGLARKIDTLTQVLQRHQQVTEPLEVLAALGGLEIAMMAGAFIQAAHERRVLLIDGFITSSALLVAERLVPGVAQFAVFAHHSVEPGHAHLLKVLNAQPLLDFDLRLGEGSGAALAYPLLKSACLTFKEMASFAEAGISEKDSH
ncbi:nicotinate-nucleotide--dimethylbenzimidazole phosphoribosyltransferase [Psychrobacter sp. FDAARGOS_221]|uniref:nicotinate-nucleotide--dimethylbenzimidazole phosphoribosyltransferase n=1 Tax=Psychrobacter sp. FDAARGOS_221 TaxID=1975705 RepID=UPI000BB54357|nr:nicotinate-nucleotide--dimethylbenzimidazole phosphoribosyltransferase [Psychrobacter sp. FDAARGOS_221]PNK61611.1 nicotinate-nucleotide--dimethylbenzimidazole phosphoribosyltransferase [Psychrobacter sp. FDAARGOS_221]